MSVGDMWRVIRISEFVRRQHEGQTDKAGFDYFSAHLQDVASKVPNALKAVAYGHDLLEDTDTTYEELVEAGFTPDEIFYISVLTHSDNQTYVEYIENIKKYEETRRVKIADIVSNLTRLYLLDNKKTRDYLTKKYTRALNILAGNSVLGVDK